MHGLRRHFHEPLPAATAVVLAVLVALAATISDGIGPNGEAAGNRVQAGLVTSGRVLASVLNTVAERLEDDWSQGGRRLKPSATPALGLHRAGLCTCQQHATPSPSSLRAHERSRPQSALAVHRRHTLNLPPPALA